MHNLDSLYELRNKFIIIGLTGRLGSGCSSVAEILGNKDFDGCKFPKPGGIFDNKNEDRKYRITYQFLKSNWNQYTIIRPSDIIVLLLLANTSEKIIAFIHETYPESKTNESLMEIFKTEEFNCLHKKSNETWNIQNKQINKGAESNLYSILIEVREFSNKLKAFLNTLI